MSIHNLPGIRHAEKLYRGYRMSARGRSPYKTGITSEGHKLVVMPGEGDNDIMHAFGEDPEPMTSKEIKKTMAKHKGIFVDVGANIGTHTIPIAMLGYKVVSIEPSPRNLDLLRRSVELNKLEKKVTIYGIAASDKSGYAGMTFVAKNSTADSIKKEDSHYMVRKERIDEIIKDPIACLKIDTEGEDLRVIQGIRNLPKKHMPAMIVVETEPSTKKGIIAELTKLGYKQEWIEFEENEYQNLGFVLK